MKLNARLFGCPIALALATAALAQGPYPAYTWPPTIDFNSSKIIHYGVIDNAFPSPAANAQNTLTIRALNGGADQGTVLAPCIRGFTGQKAAYTYMNIADTGWAQWANVPQIDILLQVYGDINVLNPTDYNKVKRIRFQLGTSASGYSSYTSPSVESFSTNAYNNQWNWILFTVTNTFWTNLVDGLPYRQLGNIKPGSSSSSAVNGGINGGTVRMQAPEGIAGFTVHAMAIGEVGAFGTISDMNVFAPMDTNAVNCPPAPSVNLVGMDFNAGTSNNLQVMTDDPTYPDQMVMYTNGVGPAGDQRKAIMPTASNGANGYLLNFGVLSNYLGEACNANEAWKVCVDFYDDPGFAGYEPPVRFGPEAYATDGQGCAGPAVYPSSGLATLTGSGQWIRRSWIVGGTSGVNLIGMNTSPLTGGPRLICVSQPVAVSRVEMAVLRTSGPLAGQDPLAGCAADPLACSGLYSNYAELDLANGITNNLDIGTPSSDQGFIVEMSGPTGDQRLSVRPGFGDNGVPGPYLQFPILNSAFGPSYQDNCGLAIVVTYYDDPALAGTNFGIDAWKYHLQAQEPIFAADATKYITLTGTAKWRDAYWQIDRIDFTGVNQAPQAAVRLKCSGRVHVCRVRYAVIRPCGPTAGQNLLETYHVTSLSAAPDTNGLMRLSWPYREPQLTIQGASTLSASWSSFMGTPIPAEGVDAVVRLSPTNNSQFFRLYRPPIP